MSEMRERERESERRREKRLREEEKKESFPCLSLPNLKEKEHEQIKLKMNEIMSCLHQEGKYSSKLFSSLLYGIPSTIEMSFELIHLTLTSKYVTLDMLSVILSHQPSLLRYQDQHGNTLYHYLSMSSYNNYHLIEYLFKKDSFSIKQSNNCHEYCLHLAVQCNPLNIPLIQLLIQYSPEIVMRKSYGDKLPIHSLFKSSLECNEKDEKSSLQLECLELLLQVNPMMIFAEITERITRINLNMPPASPDSTTAPMSPTLSPSVIPQSEPLIRLVERKWSPHSEAMKRMQERGESQYINLMDRYLTSHALSRLQEQKYRPRLEKNRYHLPFYSSCDGSLSSERDEDEISVNEQGVIDITDLSSFVIEDMEIN